MKSFIKHRLRVLLEGSKALHTPSNPIVNKEFKGKITPAKIEAIRNKIIQARKDFDSDPERYGGPEQGEGVYVFKLTDTGHFKGGETGAGYQNKVGDYEDTKNGRVRMFFIKANRGMPHPEYDEETKNWKTVKVSPAADAATKVMYYMGSAMINFLEDKAGYEDNKGAEIQKDKMSPEAIAKLKQKKDLYDRKASKSITGPDGYEAEVSGKLNDLTTKRIELQRGGYREEAKKVRGIEKQYKDEMNIITRLKNLYRSNPSKIPTEIKRLGREDLYDKLIFLDKPE